MERGESALFQISDEVVDGFPGGVGAVIRIWGKEFGPNSRYLRK